MSGNTQDYIEDVVQGFLGLTKDFECTFYRQFSEILEIVVRYKDQRFGSMVQCFSLSDLYGQVLRRSFEGLLRV